MGAQTDICRRGIGPIEAMACAFVKNFFYFALLCHCLDVTLLLSALLTYWDEFTLEVPIGITV